MGVAGDTCELLTTCRQKRAELREYKKKKALKKKEKLEKVELFREKEKERWQSFTHKVRFTSCGIFCI